MTRVAARGASLIVSRFLVRCRVCDCEILPGQKVWWVRSVGSAHEACGSDLNAIDVDRQNGDPDWFPMVGEMGGDW